MTGDESASKAGTAEASDVRREKWWRRRGNWETVVILAAPAALGGATGLLTGQTGAEPSVVAAILPAVLAGGGGAVLAYKLKRDGEGWTREYLFVSVSVVVFSVFLVVGVHAALFLNALERHKEITAHTDQTIDARKRWREDVIKDVGFRKGIAEQCSKNEAQTNFGRAALGLPPLPSGVFCDIEQLNVPGAGAAATLGEPKAE